MVLCYDCAECQRTMSVEDLFKSFGSSEYKCKGGRTFMMPIVSSPDTSPSKFENIECPHFAPIKFDDERKGSGSGRGGKKVKVAPGAGAAPSRPVDSRRRAARAGGLECSICGSEKVINVINVVNIDGNPDPAKRKKQAGASYKLCKHCSHVVNKYMVLNKVDAVRAIEVGKKRGLPVLDRNSTDDGTPVIVRGRGSETFTMEEALSVAPSKCWFCGKAATPVVEELAEGRAKLSYKCTNKKCGIVIDVDKGLL